MLTRDLFAVANRLVNVYYSTCQDESYESKEWVAQPEDEAREDDVSKERLHRFHDVRLLLR